MKRKSLSPRARGFTLQEMLITLLVGGTLIGGGISLWTVARENIVVTAANEMLTTLALARTEAIRRHTTVTLCPSRDQASCLDAGDDFTWWQDGWLLYADANDNGAPDAGEVLRAGAGSAREITIRTSNKRPVVTYQPNGTAGGSTITFALCDDALGPEHARYIVVSNGGRARVARAASGAMRCT